MCMQINVYDNYICLQELYVADKYVYMISTVKLRKLERPMRQRMCSNYWRDRNYRSHLSSIAYVFGSGVTNLFNDVHRETEKLYVLVAIGLW